MAGYVSNTDGERQAMLAAIGVKSIDDLFRDIPKDLYKPSLDIPDGMSELDAWRHLRNLASLNWNLDDHPSFLGAGSYRHFVPAVVGHLAFRHEFYTAYTPYQPEVSQGTLQAMYEWQSLVCELTGMDVSNASVYDAATGVGEAARMACAITRRRKVLVLDTVNPLHRDVLATYTTGPDIDVETVSAWRREGDRLTPREDLAAQVDESVACLIVQQPNFLGWLEQVDGLAERLKEVGAILVVVADPATLGLLRPPGEYGAGIVVAEGKWTGNPTDFGGPLVGMFACKQEYVRQMPGRLVGATVDKEAGRRGFVLTLTTREQHIRREKATSNICTSEALVALATTIYLCEMGKQGLREVGEQCLQKAHYAAEQIGALPNFEVITTAPFVKEFVVRCPQPAADVNKHLLQHSIVGGFDLGRFAPELADSLLLCCTELTRREDIERLVAELRDLS